ncbi:uncharacterized protein LOC124667903 [Lolium rigidum]|uniref:uncharacterized protein LOC124667903 n=1 Tax=Lolium rigidum TaxID=89674 RepID=UPI001F5D7A1A|nr:uncharacterized protein LOC124667903 [Lolium rigidum]
MAGGLAQIWRDWEIQLLVLLSFTLQVFLLAFARIRRRKGSAVLRILLWLAYLMSESDSTAIYTLGHLSLRTRNSGSSEKNYLMAFWAPFPLLHLGGPDTITAYALEDNQLWLRHLLTLAMQVLGAAYVLYQLYVPSTGGSLVMAASVLMFVTGLIKYGERTWALKCANIDSIRKSLDIGVCDPDSDGRRRPYDGRGRRELDAEEVLLGAHYTFNVCKSLFADSLTTSVPEHDAMNRGIELNGGKYMYELIEMQLSLMYDILYTKAAVIHTWYGWCIRVVSPTATLTAFLLFQLDNNDNIDAYRVDAIVTYVLLLGALVVETTSLFRAIGSSWTCASLHARRWDLLYGALVCIRRRFKAANSRRWLYSIGQYSLLGFCTRDTTEWRSRITKRVGLGDWWNKLHYSSTTEVSQSARDLVLGAIPRRELGDMRNARGRWILQKVGLYDEISWSIDDADFDQSILIWHVVTDVYLCCRETAPPAAAEAGNEQAQDQSADDLLAKTVRELSNYMMFLYVVRPEMLPGPVRGSRYDNNCHGLDTLWQQRSPELQGRDDYGARTPREHLARLLLREYGDDSDDHGSGTSSSSSRHADVSSIQIEDNNPHGLAYIDGAGLAGMLLSDEWGVPDVLQMIAEVWIEMLCYAARHCSEIAHSKQLSNGGELVTAIGLLVEYTARSNFHRDGLAAANGTAPAGTSMADGDASTRAAEISTTDADADRRAAEISTADGDANDDASTRAADISTADADANTRAPKLSVDPDVC